jgi:DNA repair protein RadC
MNSRKSRTTKSNSNNKQAANPDPLIQDTFIREARVNYLHCEQVMFRVSSPADVVNFVRSILTDNSREHFVALYLDGQNQVAAYSIVSIGSANSAPVAPREVFQRAVLTGAIAIVLAHNHPSGSTVPSRDDRAVTTRLREAGELMGIKILDHLIVTNSAFVSMKEEDGW